MVPLSVEDDDLFSAKKNMLIICHLELKFIYGLYHNEETEVELAANQLVFQYVQLDSFRLLYGTRNDNGTTKNLKNREMSR